MASLRRINQDDLRNHNLSVVIDTLLRASTPMSRANLAKETGLTKATMSLLVSLLIDAGIVKEGEPQNSSSYGRPSTPLALGGGKVCGIGMQVNTDGYGCVALDINRDTLGYEWVDADMGVFGRLDAMVGAMEDRLEGEGCIVAGVACALPGLVTSERQLLTARNLGWENIDLSRFDVMRRYDVRPGNEAKMAAIAQIPGYACARADFLDAVDCTDSFIYLSCDIGSAEPSCVTARSWPVRMGLPAKSVTCRLPWTDRCADAAARGALRHTPAGARWWRPPVWSAATRRPRPRLWTGCWTPGIPVTGRPWRRSIAPSTR